jgi:hypothetical protein
MRRYKRGRSISSPDFHRIGTYSIRKKIREQRAIGDTHSELGAGRCTDQPSFRKVGESLEVAGKYEAVEKSARRGSAGDKRWGMRSTSVNIVLFLKF